MPTDDTLVAPAVAPPRITFRSASADDALTLSVLATQVFLDTYATHGVDRDLASEVHTVYAPEVFAQRLRDPGVEITVAVRGPWLVGFLDLAFTTQCPLPSIQGLEVLRLYVQAPFQRAGVGRQLMALAERRARQAAQAHVWLTAWSGNTTALAFYPAMGYQDVGTTQYLIEGQAYENRVFAKRITPSRSPDHVRTPASL